MDSEGSETPSQTHSVESALLSVGPRQVSTMPTLSGPTGIHRGAHSVGL